MNGAPYVGLPPDSSNTQPIEAIASTLEVSNRTPDGALIGGAGGGDASHIRARR